MGFVKKARSVLRRIGLEGWTLAVLARLLIDGYLVREMAERSLFGFPLSPAALIARADRPVASGIPSRAIYANVID